MLASLIAACPTLCALWRQLLRRLPGLLSVSAALGTLALGVQGFMVVGLLAGLVLGPRVPVGLMELPDRICGLQLRLRSSTALAETEPSYAASTKRRSGRDDSARAEETEGVPSPGGEVDVGALSPTVSPPPGVRRVPDSPAVDRRHPARVPAPRAAPERRADRLLHPLEVSAESFLISAGELREGYLPATTAPRSESFVNAQRYGYPRPPAEQPFAISVEALPSPLTPGHVLLRLGLARPGGPPAPDPALAVVFTRDPALEAAWARGFIEGSLELNMAPGRVQSWRLLGFDEPIEDPRAPGWVTGGWTERGELTLLVELSLTPGSEGPLGALTLTERSGRVWTEALRLEPLYGASLWSPSLEAASPETRLAYAAAATAWRLQDPGRDDLPSWAELLLLVPAEEELRVVDPRGRREDLLNVIADAREILEPSPR